MPTAAQQLRSAANQFAPQIYHAVMAQPTVAGRAQVLRAMLVRIDRGLSDRVAARVEALEAQGVAPRQAVLQALSDGLTVHMAELVRAIESEGLGGNRSCGCARQGLSGLGTVTRTTTTTRSTGSVARLNAVSSAITNIGGLVNDLTATAGNIAVSAMQSRRGQTVTGLPGVQQPIALEPLGPLAPLEPLPAAAPPWGLILGGVAVLGVLGVGYYMTQQKKPAPAAAAT